MQKKRKKKKKHFLLKFILLILVILILSGILLVLIQLDRVKRHNIDNDNIIINDIDNEDLNGYTNIVLFGVDSRLNDLKKDTRSDSIIVASINNETDEVKLVSIYRDTYVNITGHGYSKINAAYAKGGPELAINTINRNFDLDIKDFVTVNFSALTHVIDALGGVEIDIKKDELTQVNNYTRDINKINGTNSPLLTSPGRQTLNGTQATAYSRVRYTAGSDYRRTERQRNVIYGLMEKVKSASKTTLLSLANEMLPEVYTSLSNTKILSLAAKAPSFKIAADTGFPFEKQGKTIHKASVVLPINLDANVTQLHKFLFGTTNYVPSNTVKEISNELRTK